jgi:hypothetical protein
LSLSKSILPLQASKQASKHPSFYGWLKPGPLCTSSSHCNAQASLTRLTGRQSRIASHLKNHWLEDQRPHCYRERRTPESSRLWQLAGCFFSALPASSSLLLPGPHRPVLASAPCAIIRPAPGVLTGKGRGPWRAQRREHRICICTEPRFDPTGSSPLVGQQPDPVSSQSQAIAIELFTVAVATEPKSSSRRRPPPPSPCAWDTEANCVDDITRPYPRCRLLMQDMQASAAASVI